MKRHLPLIVAFMAFASAASAATEVLTNLGASWDNGRIFNASQDIYSGLAFKTGPTGGTIDSLSVSLIAGNTPSPYPTITFSMYLYQLDGSHLPTGAALGTQNGLSATFSGTLPFIQQSFTYGNASLTGITSVNLAADTEYAIVLGNNNANDEYYFATKNSPVYTTSDGYSWVGSVNSDDSGANWNLQTNEGYIASLSVNAVPEPSTAWLIAAGSLSFVLVVRSRRKNR